MKQPQNVFAFVSSEDWNAVIDGQNRLSDKIDALSNLILTRNADNASSEWLTLEEARQLLNVSPKTFQKYRDNGIIPFSQFGRKIYFKRKDIEDFLNSKRVRR